ncbi:hypothetical protein LQ327_01645 [Actinomycetospora endophytica]|uniref:Uncharacterized protein n=1 Tax=Actinomycetospora endophytica TaxID=2291215 RepID=A0ABS8P3F2_9PSEU|nr:hypothetical protein [Actinomycetospora endophytica]MCD2192095.1 hypothetical protein [Actinomycetospora endophytica]
MHCVLAGVGRYDGMVQRPPGPDGEPPTEVELIAAKRPLGDDRQEVDVIVFRYEGLNPDGLPRYLRDRVYTEQRSV